MGRPSSEQIAEAIIDSVRAGESDAAFDARIAGLSRMSDEELAAMGIFPRAEPVKPGAQRKSRAAGLRGPALPRFRLW